MQASEFMLDDATYANVKDGWNLKLNASSQKLSDLTPFIELYAVFATNDTIFKNPMMFSQVADRAIDIQFQFTKGSHRDTAFEFEDRFQIPMNAKIVPIASSAKSQIEPDIMWDTSYRGQAGINDLAVTRGASGPMNIKYSMNMTMPNPEVINEMYEYSKLMILNSKFLLVYGWNPSEFIGVGDPAPTILPPPRLVNMSSSNGYPVDANVVELNSHNGGFYRSTLITLNRFSFTLDNVGHLGGKLDFLTLAGNFLAATRSSIVSTSVKKMLNGYNGMLFSAGAISSGTLAGDAASTLEALERQVADARAELEESEAYAAAWLADMQRRHLAFRDSEEATTTNKYALDVGPPFTATDRFRGTRNHGDWLMQDLASEERAAEELGITLSEFRSLSEEEIAQRLDLSFDGGGTGADFADLGHVGFRLGKMVRPFGEMGVEFRADPYADARLQVDRIEDRTWYEREGKPWEWIGLNDSEYMRYQRFTGVDVYGQEVPKIAGVNYHTQYGSDMEDQASVIDWPEDVRYMNEAGMGWGESKWDTRRRFFGSAVGPPRRLRDPQFFSAQDLLTNPLYKDQVDQAMDLWQADPGFEGFAASMGYFPREVEQFEAGANGQRVPAGVKKIYVPGENATDENKITYEGRFADFFGSMVSDSLRTYGPAGQIPGVPIQYTEDRLQKIPFLKWYLERLTKEKEDYGFMDIENGIPWVNPKKVPPGEFDSYLAVQRAENDYLMDANGNPVVDENGDYVVNESNDSPIALDTMPAYGRDLMNDIWNNFMQVDNPNRSRFFPVNPEDPSEPVNRNYLGKRWRRSSESERIAINQIDFLDPETLKIMQSSCAISTMLLNVHVDQEESEELDRRLWEDQADFFDEAADFFGYETEDMAALRERDAYAAAEETLGGPPITDGVPDELTKLSIFAQPIENQPNVILQATAQPVFYFLGAVLEALRIAMSSKVKFIYDDIPLEGAIAPGGYPVPVPKINTDTVAQLQEQITQEETAYNEWYEGYNKIRNLHPDAVTSYKDDRGHEWPNKSGEKTKKWGEEAGAAGYKYPTKEEYEANEDGLWGGGIIGRLFEGYEMDFKPALPYMNNNHRDTNGEAWGWAISDEEFERQADLLRQRKNLKIATLSRMEEMSNSIMDPLMCKNVFELPVSINVIRKILTETTAPLHALINQILKACNATNKTIKLATRPWAADETYLEIFVANIRVDGVAQEVFENFDVHGFLQDASVRNAILDKNLVTNREFNLAAAGSNVLQNTTPAELAAARNATLGAYFSTKAIVCEFGSERSLVESFNLSSKVDPLAFSTFRLPEVIGGQSIDIAAIVRGNLENESMGLMNDIREILEDGMYHGHEQLKDLQIVGGRTISGKQIVNTQKLKNFLLANDSPATKVQTTFLTSLMASDQAFNTKVMALQNEAITGSGDPNNPQNNSFYGGVLSTYLRSISLTIHGVVGLSMFNVLYIKGLMRGIEGLYLITSVNESLTPASFSTSLECKLIQYKDSSDANPLAGNLNITLAEAAAAARGTQVTDFDALFNQTEANLSEDKGDSILTA